MGLRGRKPKPTRIHELNGNPGRRPLNDREPKPLAGIPPCPKHLDKEARKEWKRLSKELHRTGVLTIVDMATLAGFCAAWSRWIEAEAKCAEEGRVLVTDKGWCYANPWVAIGNKALEEIRRFGALLGLDPSSRSRLKVEAEAEQDELGLFLGDKEVS